MSAAGLRTDILTCKVSKAVVICIFNTVHGFAVLQRADHQPATVPSNICAAAMSHN